jgi:hypothetical protein
VIYSLTVLKRNGNIERVGKAWKVKKEETPDKVSYKKTHRVGMEHTPPFVTDIVTKKIRGHGFQFTLRIPKLDGWEDRANVLVKKKIPFIELKSQRAQRISIGGIEKVWLCPGSIVFYLGKTSFFSDKPSDAGVEALDFTLKAIRRLENDLGIGAGRLKTGRGYNIKVSRSHYAIIHDGLAKRMDSPRQKIQVYDEKGLWFLIDNSFNLHEAEFVRPDTNVDEATFYKNIWLNDLNKTRLTPSATLAAIKRVEKKTLPESVRKDIEDIKNITLGSLSTENALANSLNMQTVILKTLSEKVCAIEKIMNKV